MTPLPVMTTSPIVTPSAGTSTRTFSPGAVRSTTRTVSAWIIATPWRDFSAARSSGSSSAQPGCGVQTVNGP